MVEVNLFSGLRAFAGGAAMVEVEGTNVGEVLANLARAHPGLKDILQDSVSVAVDGQIIAGDDSAPVPPGAEVWLVSRMRGG